MKKVSLLFALLGLASFILPASAATPTVAGTFCYQANYGGTPQTFSACIVLVAQQLDANGNGKGSLYYMDPNFTFVVDVSYVKIVGKKAYFAGSSLLGNPPGIPAGTWFYEVAADNGEPGVGLDTLGGSGLGLNAAIQAASLVTGATDITQTGDLLITSGDIHVGVIPTTKDDCKDEGWRQLVDNSFVPFKNQGACVSFIQTGK
jgi:hypothetical protein